MVIPFILFSAFLVVVIAFGMRKQRAAFGSWAQHANSSRRDDDSTSTESSTAGAMFTDPAHPMYQHHIDHHGLPTHEQHLVRHHGMDPHTAQLHGGATDLSPSIGATDIGSPSTGSTDSSFGSSSTGSDTNNL